MIASHEASFLETATCRKTWCSCRSATRRRRRTCWPIRRSIRSARSRNSAGGEGRDPFRGAM